MKTTTKKTAADKANEKLDEMMTEAEKEYWKRVAKEETGG
jgi:hypothetical protein